jgi:tetrahydromethanopterin S-methyltransferase subunit B
MQIEERVAKIEGTIEQMNERLNHIETDLRDLRENLTKKIESNFRWTIGLMITMWITIILTIVFRG